MIPLQPGKPDDFDYSGQYDEEEDRFWLDQAAGIDYDAQEQSFENAEYLRDTVNDMVSSAKEGLSHKWTTMLLDCQFKGRKCTPK